MTIWTRRQMGQVQRVRAAALLDPVMLRRRKRPDGTMTAEHVEAAMSAVREKLARQIVQTCHAFVVEVHPGDIEFNTESVPIGLRVEARWRPRTNEVEFVGGPADGSVYAVRDAPWGEVVVAVKPGLPAFATDLLAEPSAYDDITPWRVVYRVTGWHEAGRRWIYGTS